METEEQRKAIALNLIGILNKDEKMTHETCSFITDWLLTDRSGKKTDFFDVWDIVLKKYLPATRPILFRTCSEVINGKIASFTGSLESARRFSKDRKLLLICDTKETLQFESLYFNPGSYENTFFPLITILEKAKEAGNWGFREETLNSFIEEDEYIMRVNEDNVSKFRWD